ncbi:MAG TPA: hypothetical protein VM510_04340, partial [Caulifigura sp.]|nr:hypothetical protein [Caulifigura sp.]
CNHCGGPLRVPESTRFVTCGYCHVQLAIRHDGAAVFTEVLEELSTRTSNIENQLEAIRVENDLERIEREWEQKKQEIVGRGRNPTDRTEILWISLGLTVFCLVIAYQVNRRVFQPLPTLVLVAIPLVFLVFFRAQADLFDRAQSLYFRSRRRVFERSAQRFRPDERAEKPD